LTILKFASLQIQKLALRAQTLSLRPFRFTKNGYQEFFNVRSRDLGSSPSTLSLQDAVQYPPIDPQVDTQYKQAQDDLQASRENGGVEEGKDVVLDKAGSVGKGFP
jgi:hypothetical protein